MRTLLLPGAALSSPVPLLTIREARMLGIRLSPAGHHRVRPGVYADAQAWDALPPWRRYEARVHAYLRVRPDAILCFESAAVLHGIPLIGETRDIHVFSPLRTASRRFGDVVVHTSASGRAVEEIAGARVTSIADTVADLVRVLPPAHALAAADAVLHATRGTLTVGDLRRHAAAQPSTRGMRLADWVWERAHADAESPGESVSRAVIEWLGFEEPELQRRFAYEGFHDRADFFFPRANAVGESDGWGKYQLEDADAAKRHLTVEKRREDRLRRNGHPFARWDLRDAFAVSPVRRALEAAGVPVLRPVQHAMLATLRTNPRRMRHAASAERPRETTKRTRNQL